MLLTKKKNIHLALHMRDTLPLVFADISLVGRAIQNLMDNALKFNPYKGTVTISIFKRN